VPSHARAVAGSHGESYRGADPKSYGITHGSTHGSTHDGTHGITHGITHGNTNGNTNGSTHGNAHRYGPADLVTCPFRAEILRLSRLH